MFQAQYSIQRAFDHTTTSPCPKGSVKNIYGGDTKLLPAVPSPFDSSLFPAAPQGGQADALGDSLHRHPQELGKLPL